MVRVYCTSYCNRGHRLKDGVPVGHECRIIPASALRAEREGKVAEALEILQNSRTIIHKGVRDA